MRRLFIVGVFVLGSASRAHGYGESPAGFPNWEERTLLQWTNRSRADPQMDLAACPANRCGEKACYMPKDPIINEEPLNRAARFHSDEMLKQSTGLTHDSKCILKTNIADLYPATCDAAAACACESAGTMRFNERVARWGASASGEIAASTADPEQAFYLWLFETWSGTACGYQSAGGQTNGHRYQLLNGGPAVGFGASSGSATGDFGQATIARPKLVSGSHYPRQGSLVEVWASWADAAGPKKALVNVDGACNPMTLSRGSATNGAYKTTLNGVGSGCHRYYFIFEDSAGTTSTYPTTGSFAIGPEASCANWDPARPNGTMGCDVVIPPQPDGGVAVNDGGRAIDAFLQAGDGGNSNDPFNTGCGCQTGKSSSQPLLAGLMVLAVVLLMRRRR